MKRDIICFLRILVDSLPKYIRNSYLLFKLAQLVFKVPETLYKFREKYNNGEYKDLTILYKKESKYSLTRNAEDTDINYLHLRKLYSLLDKSKYKTLIDVGCGTGFLLNQITKKFPEISLSGLDISDPKYLHGKRKNISFIKGDLNNKLSMLESNYYDFVICAHVIEHVSNPQEVLNNLRRIAKKRLIIICPLEKPFKWGMNYHINFFSDISRFLIFVHHDFKLNNKKVPEFNFSRNLGDVFYIEYL